MRWLSSFALIVYLSLLCTPQAFAVHDARLSPLADTQFHAITTPATECLTKQHDSAGDPDPVLPISDSKLVAALPCCYVVTIASEHNGTFYAFIQARAPPVSSFS